MIAVYTAKLRDAGETGVAAMTGVVAVFAVARFCAGRRVQRGTCTFGEIYAMQLTSIHHIAIICANYERSKDFYTRILGMEIVREVYRAERASWKLDLSLNGHYVIELFSFPAPPPRPSRPEALGLRHLAFSVPDISQAVQDLNEAGIATEPVRTDEWTGRLFTFFTDPDGLPLELYQA